MSISIAQKYIDGMRQGLGVDLSVEVYPSSGRSFKLTKSNIVQGTFVIDRTVCSGDVLEIGSAIAAELSFTMKNEPFTDPDGKSVTPADVIFEGANLIVKLTLHNPSDSETVVLPLGIFVVDEQPRKLSTISIKALDYMMRFDYAHNGSLGTSLLATVQSIVQAVEMQLSSDSVTFLNKFGGVYTLPDSVADKEGLTARQILMWVGEMTASCAYVDENGYLAFKQYPQSALNALTITEADRYSSDMQESDITITGITVTPTDSESEAVTIGAQGYEWNIEGNQLLVSPDEMASAPLGYSENNKFFKYRPFTASTKAFPHLWPLDVINFSKNSDGTVNVHRSVITQHTWKLNGGSSIVSVGKSARKKGYASQSGLTAKQKAVIERAVGTAVKSQISGYQQAILDINKQAQGALGLYNTKNEDTGVIYFHNQPNIKDSTYIYMETSAGRFMATGPNAWNDGNPVWTNAWTSMGQIVAHSMAAGTITTDLLSVGSAANANDRTSSVIIDKTGLDIYDGAIKIYDKNGNSVISTDTSGNLSIVGNLKTGAKSSYYAELSYGGLSFYNGTTLVNKFGIEKFIDKENNTETLITTTEKGLNIKSGQILTNSSFGYEPFAGLKHFRSVIGGKFSVGVGIGKANSDKSATGSIEVRDEYYNGAPIYSRLDFTKSTVDDCVIDIRGSYDVGGELKYSKWLSLGEKYMRWNGDIAPSGNIELGNGKAIYGYTSAGIAEILIQKSSGNNVVVGNKSQSGETNIYTALGTFINFRNGMETYPKVAMFTDNFGANYGSASNVGLGFYLSSNNYWSIFLEDTSLKFMYKVNGVAVEITSDGDLKVGNISLKALADKINT